MNASPRLIEEVLPATVSIYARVPEDHPSVPILGVERMGSGTLIEPRGLVLTVNYVLIGAQTVQVTLLDKTNCDGEIAAQDYGSGLAAVKIRGNGFPSLTPHTSAQLKQGDEVFMVASLGEEGRRVNGGAVTSLGPFDAYWEYCLDRAVISTAMNPGLGGGALMDMKGRLVGVVSLNLNEVGRFSLAIPTENFTDYKDELLRHGRRVSRPSRAWLGLYSHTFGDRIVVAGVLPGGPGETSGLKSGDVILDVNGREVSDRRQLYDYLWSHRAGETISLRVFRNNAVHTIEVVSENVEEFFA